ncbi:C-terminal binding protein [Chelativorans salis]|uniref:C-terminal binding protein n=1 Tax=Chelativorans salis TaxID=2978478 RepID=A0ABT2LQ22_9HYPH|nr:C-terminal binding protein [Chelativorans sp. EGI FJ00035]MCT7376655.1 C-terminal binding protein [Chelativorans sp. EGI FJ00035]
MTHPVSSHHHTRDGDRAPVAVVIDAGYDQHTIEEDILKPYGFRVIERACHGDAAAVVEAVREADAVLVRESPVTANAIDEMKHCRVIVRYGVGVDNIHRRRAAERGIYVANVPDYGVEEVSDHTLALLLSVLRRTAARDRAVREGMWNVARREPMHRIAGRTLGIIGYGRIGAAFHRKVSTLGFSETRVHDANGGVLPYGAVAADLDELIARSDVISLHLPLRPSTEKMISRERIAAMQPGTVIVNTSRGGLIDEESLVEALQSGHLGGAGLDVFADEPPAPDHPLLSTPNTVLSDHTAWYSEESVAELQTKAAQEVARVFAGEAPKHWVNRWD